MQKEMQRISLVLVVAGEHVNCYENHIFHFKATLGVLLTDSGML